MTLQAAALAVYAAADALGLASGAVQILDSGGAVIRQAAFNAGSAGAGSAAVFTAAGFPKATTGNGAAAAASAKLVTSGGQDYKTGLSVGLPGSGANVIIDVTAGPNAGTLTIGATDVVTVQSVTLTHASGA